MRGQDQFLENDDQGIKKFKRRTWIPLYGDLRQLLLAEAHNSRLSVHPGSVKMYKGLQPLYWWPGMKKDVVQYVEKCLTCAQVKAEHQKPYGMLQPLEIPVWK